MDLADTGKSLHQLLRQQPRIRVDHESSERHRAPLDFDLDVGGLELGIASQDLSNFLSQALVGPPPPLWSAVRLAAALFLSTLGADLFLATADRRQASLLATSLFSTLACHNPSSSSIPSTSSVRNLGLWQEDDCERDYISALA